MNEYSSPLIDQTLAEYASNGGETFHFLDKALGYRKVEDKTEVTVFDYSSNDITSVVLGEEELRGLICDLVNERKALSKAIIALMEVCGGYGIEELKAEQ